MNIKVNALEVMLLVVPCILNGTKNSEVCVGVLNINFKKCYGELSIFHLNNDSCHKSIPIKWLVEHDVSTQNWNANSPIMNS